MIAITGGPEYREGNSCTVNYEGLATEMDGEVRVRIIPRSPRPAVPENHAITAPRGRDTATLVGGKVCTLKGYTRLITLALTRRFGGRRLIDEQFGRQQPVFDGSQLAEPTWLPEGWSLLSEGPAYPKENAARYWVRTWGVPAPPSTGGHCTPTATPVALLQGPSDALEQYGSNGEQPARRYEVRGHQARYFAGGEASEKRLAWAEGDQAFVLASRSRCLGDTPPSPEVLVRIAESRR